MIFMHAASLASHVAAIAHEAQSGLFGLTAQALVARGAVVVLRSARNIAEPGY